MATLLSYRCTTGSMRQMLTAYNKNTLAGGGCHDKDIGLTAFGSTVIAEMNRVGMLVDCSHTGYRTTMDIMEVATQPVIFFTFQSKDSAIARAQHYR